MDQEASRNAKSIISRFFVGGGFVIPSKYTLTESPWTKTVWDHDGDGIIDPEEKYYSPHRHFYLSDGTYKMFTEVQFFKKRLKRPVFWGGALSYEFPIGESDYGFEYSFSGAEENGIIRPSITPSVFELKNPNRDIYGKVI